MLYKYCSLVSTIFKYVVIRLNLKCQHEGNHVQTIIWHTSTEGQHTHTQPFYGSVEFVREKPGEPVPEETFTHYSHRSHQSEGQHI